MAETVKRTFSANPRPVYPAHEHYQFKFANMSSKKETRGFASMQPERRQEIARLGGKAAHKAGTAHKFTPAEATLAGRKGGRAGANKPRVKKQSNEKV